MNLRHDTLLAGVLIFLSCTSVVKTQELISGASDIGLFTGFSNIASFGLGTLMGFFVKQCPACSEPTPSLACPDSFTASTVGNKTWCYKYSSIKKDREDASRDCADMAPKNADGQLLGIETEEESEAVRDYLIDNDLEGKLLWIAATDYNQDGTYIWDKNGATVSNVILGQGFCAVSVFLDSDITFLSGDCANIDSYGYICESEQVLLP